MLILQDTPVGDLTRGGQILIHFIRMLGQVMRRFGGALVLAILVATGLTFLLLTQPYERYLGWRFVTSYVATDVLRNGREITNFERADGTVIEVRQEALRASHALQQRADALLQRAETSFWIALAGVLLLFVLAVGWIWKSGRRQRKDQWLRGTEIVDELALARLLKERRLASDLHVGQIPLRAGSETLHILFTGSTGTGKSSSLYQLIEQIRRRRERIICYSPVGDFIEYFYRPGKDTILNPFDDRSPSWNLWDECPEPYHYDMLATAIIPDQAHVPDPFWTSAARSVISCLAQETARRNERDVRRFLSLLQGDLATLHAYLRNTEAGAQLAPESDKPALSIRTTAVTYARSLKYLPAGRTPFHIRQWVHNDKGDGCIFMTAKDDQREAIRPLLSAWLEMFTIAILSLPPDRNRRIWLILDELPTLHKIPSLANFLSQGRKFGACGLIGFQQVSQLRECYGTNGAQTVVGGCATWLCMRQNDHETAKWTAESLGEVELMEAQQGLSYGANDMRDGVSLTQLRKLRQVLIPSEVSNLDDLEAYIRLPGRLPIGHMQLKWKDRKKVAPAFVPSTADPIGKHMVIADPEAPTPTITGDLFPVDQSPPEAARNATSASAA